MQFSKHNIENATIPTSHLSSRQSKLTSWRVTLFESVKSSQKGRNKIDVDEKGESVRTARDIQQIRSKEKACSDKRRLDTSWPEEGEDDESFGVFGEKIGRVHSLVSGSRHCTQQCSLVSAPWFYFHQPSILSLCKLANSFPIY